MAGIFCFVKRCYGSEKGRAINPLVLISNNQNIYFNLSLENFLLTNYNELLTYLNVNTIEKYNKPVLFLWRNNRSIIIGKNQNIWSECDLDNIKKNNVLVARRFTGGGAVYHDLGNVCFTFLNNNINKNNNYNILLNTLKNHFNIDAKLHGRNDITVNDKKCSGSAFKNIKDVFLHHGTILINIEKDVLNKYLTPDKTKYIKHGVSSVNARTVNLKEINNNITCENLCIALIKEFQKFYNIPETNSVEEKNNEIFENPSINNIDQQNTNLINNTDVVSNNLNVHYIDTNQNIIKNPQFLKYYNLLKDWDWCYGKTPKFQNTFCKQFSFGRLEICFDVKNGLIKDGNIFSDSLDINLIDQLKLIFNNDIKYTKESINDFLKNIKVENKEALQEITSWILEEL
ncbi:lipoate-protein ligase 1, putative [Plasmodium chabaudi chabaudi]|uniref:lipoate--protein ligase n=1 Tax=Plasmodium chabaudi chabaudi TaxID=31271 RepID=A0A4V0KBY4_PLACU|nr:lipoate-protein ligase 1, putative [Plasmodium chabaudi chabaudi]VTZ70826.1 lipoate-protein ligase 1, putative [Plasmodium chabaudi chabaudi]|eukprot:XP_739988.2 lipoate-protein ligase a, putative [Plasmodium chabaudi chabaudi]